MINTDPKHRHTYDSKGNMTCCSLAEKINAKTEHNHSDDDGHDHDHESESPWKEYVPAIISFIFLMSGLVFDYFIKPSFFQATPD